MTLKTAKRLYEHYIAQGMKKEAEDILKKRPEIAQKVEPKKKK